MKKNAHKIEATEENEVPVPLEISEEIAPETTSSDAEEYIEQNVEKPKKSLKKHLLLKTSVFLVIACAAIATGYYLVPQVYNFLDEAKPVVVTPKKTEPSFQMLKPQSGVVSVEEKTDTREEPVVEDFVPVAPAVEPKQTESVLLSTELSEPLPEPTPIAEEIIAEPVLEPTFPASEQIPEPVLEPTSLSVSEPSSLPVSEVQPQPIERKEVTPPAPQSAKNLFMLKALELKDSFKNGNKCRVVLEELISMPDKTPAVNEALMNLLQVCLEQPKEGKIQEVFARSKKQVILQIFKDEYPLYLAYFKALPYLLADIRQKHPEGDDPMAILNRIQIAVNSEKPSQVLTLIDALPQSVQPYLYDVRQYAEHESALYQTLNNLIQALFSQEEAK